MTAANGIKPRIYSIIADVFGVPPSKIDEASSQDSIEGWDSLSHIHLVVALEAEFAVTLEPDEAITMTSVAEIHRVLVDKGAAAA
jgi:acyl carrier protein